jgi:hypothetical protein
MRRLSRSANKMAGDEVIFSFVHEPGFFGLTLFFEMGASRLEQTSSIRRQEMLFLFQKSFFPFLRGIQFGDGLK